MNIYEMSIQKFNEFKGNRLTIWKSERSEVWMEVNQDFDVCVYVSRNGKTRNGRWMIGSMMYQNGVMSYKLNSEYKLKTDYKAWTGRVQKE